MRKITFSDHLRYRFDNTMSRGPVALIGWLFVMSAAIIGALSLVVYATNLVPAADGSRPDFWHVVWMALMRTLDAGTMGGDDGSWPFLFTMLAITLAGIFLVSTLIGVLTTGIDAKLDELRRGRSFVVEQNHTLVLGWSPLVPAIISELVVANASTRGACVVILADRDKVEMEEEIRAHVGSTGRTRVVCRTGNPLDLTALAMVNPDGARSIIVLAADVADPDIHVIKTVLALTRRRSRRPTPLHIVAELQSEANVEVARMVGAHELEVVNVDQLIARVTVQTSQQPGLSAVYNELLDFDGDEIYMRSEPALVGKSFAEALAAYEKCAVIGVVHGGERVQLLPPMDTRLGAKDQLILIAEDDSVIKVGAASAAAVDSAAIRTGTPAEPVPSRTLILGWNRRAPLVLSELNAYMAHGSEVLVLTTRDEAEGVIAELAGDLAGLNVSFRSGDPTSRPLLNTLDVARFEHVMVLSDDASDAEESDARTLVTLLHLRDIAEQTSHRFNIVSEVLDVRNRELAEALRADDFIVSTRLVGLMLSQISENKLLAPVFTDLMDSDGAELYFRPADLYVVPGTPVSFYTVIEAARQRGQIAMGYWRQAPATDDKLQGIRVNPSKSELVSFTPADRIIVLSEN